MKSELMLAILTAPKRDSRHWTQEEISWGEILDWIKTPSRIKACGNYVLGTFEESTVRHRAPNGNLEGADCTNLHRRKTAVAARGALTLDVDTPTEGFIELALLELDGTEALIHTTYNSTPESPRYRVIIPLDREVKPDEYHVAAASMMQRLGDEQFDQGSVEPERYMFKPSSKKVGDFRSWILHGQLCSADDLLEDFDADLSVLPMPAPSRKKRDPFAIDGTIGAFNRAYSDFGDLISEYNLPYTEVGAERWQLAGAAAAAGMGVISPGLVFSHHANDPASGNACSAFDLARLHLFSELDEGVKSGTPVNRLPSNAAMLDLAATDSRVVTELVGKDFADDLQDIADEVEGTNWKERLRLDPKHGIPLDDIRNWDLIIAHEPAFKVLQYNELTMAIEISGALPWRSVESAGETFSAGDRSRFALHIERVYGIRAGRGYLDDLINDVALNRRVNPVRDYLQSLQWDGVPRVETALPGVRPNPYTRMVARKVLTAAVARMMDPGCKWDHMLVLYGTEGLGKTYWVDTMSKGFSSALGALNNKDTLITMQRSWILTSDEGHSLKKADFDAQKEFITKTADVFRMPYDREAAVHKRHNVIWGTTNDRVFLRRQEGNRRFLIVHCQDKVDFGSLTPEYVDQVWAEALHLWRSGERLYVTEEEGQLAAEAREGFTEEDAMVGVLSEYLETPVPASWSEMSPDARVMHLLDAQNGQNIHDSQIQEVCSAQLWTEALGRRRGEHRRVDLLEISEAMEQIPGWKVSSERRRITGYGSQKIYVRVNPRAASETFAEADLEDLL